MILDAERKGILKKGDTLIETSSGNTGIGLAGIALIRGYKAKIMISDIASQERINLLKFLGAEVLFYSHIDGRGAAIEMAKKLAKENDWVMLHQYENESNVLAQEETAQEILESLEIENIIPDYLILGIGTGGTITGMSRIFKKKFPNIKVVGIIPAGKIEGIRDFRDINPKILNLNLIDEIIEVKEEDSRNSARELAQKYGLLLGFSSAAVYHLSKKIAEMEDGKKIITLFPDGIEKYLSYI
jgi:cysteine synthase A